jgi:hypothetical protein
MIEVNKILKELDMDITGGRDSSSEDEYNNNGSPFK